MLLAWAYSRLLAGSEALADVGAVSFSALATLVPALCFAVLRPQTPPRAAVAGVLAGFAVWRSEEHKSELQSLMRTSYAVFSLKTKNYKNKILVRDENIH